jgi:hypothetical protein
MASIGETAKQVFGLLRESNRTALSATHRGQFIDAIEPLVNYITDNLIRRFIGIAFPLTTRYRGVALAARELQVEMATCYKLLALDYAKTNAATALLPALHGAMRYMGRTLLQSALTYEPPPHYLWLDLHQVYSYSEQQQLHQRPVPLKDTAQPEHNSSLLDIYKKILLFTISSPARLQQNQIQRLYTAAQEWAKQGILSADNDPQAEPAPFIVDLTTDLAPRYLALTHAEPSSAWRYFETRHIRKLVRELAREGEFTQALSDDNATRTETQTGLPRSLIKRLLLIWKAMPKRNYPRTTQDGEMDVCLGFAACYELLKLRRRRQRRLAAGLSTDEATMNLKLEGSALHEDEHLASNKKTKSAVWDQNQFVSAQTFISRVVNEAAGSLCLALEPSSAAKARVGEVIGIAPRQDAAAVSLGVIRWLRSSTQGVEFGMEMLSPIARAGLISKFDPGSAAEPALLFPAIEALAQASSLLTSTYGYQVGDIIKIQDDTGDKKVRLTQLTDTIGVLHHFEFVEIRPEKTEQDKEALSIDNVWSFL